MKPLLLLLIIVFVASCGCLDTAPQHDFEINETREFEFIWDGDLDYTGHLTWDGEHFTIYAQGLGYQDGMYLSTAVRGIDNDARMVITSGPGMSYIDEHIDFSRTVFLKEMIAHCE